VHDDEEAYGELSVFGTSEAAHVEIAFDRSEYEDYFSMRVSKRWEVEFYE